MKFPYFNTLKYLKWCIYYIYGVFSIALGDPIYTLHICNVYTVFLRCGLGRKNASVSGVYCCIYPSKAPYIHYIYMYLVKISPLEFFPPSLPSKWVFSSLGVGSEGILPSHCDTEKSRNNLRPKVFNVIFIFIIVTIFFWKRYGFLQEIRHKC